MHGGRGVGRWGGCGAGRAKVAKLLPFCAIELRSFLAGCGNEGIVCFSYIRLLNDEALIFSALHY